MSYGYICFAWAFNNNHLENIFNTLQLGEMTQNIKGLGFFQYNSEIMAVPKKLVQ
jgi:hypothetical protein